MKNHKIFIDKLRKLVKSHSSLRRTSEGLVEPLEAQNTPQNTLEHRAHFSKHNKRSSKHPLKAINTSQNALKRHRHPSEPEDVPGGQVKVW